jgi:hypothetical protein
MVMPLQLDSPDTVAVTVDEVPAGFGLSASDGVPEQAITTAALVDIMEFVGWFVSVASSSNL